MKIVTIIGARPQFVKAAAVSREIAKYKSLKEVIVHTGQHFDKNMSDIFFSQLNIPKPDYNLNINNLTHGTMTGMMLRKIEEVLLVEEPDWVLVYGDTNSTLAGALAAAKLQIKVAHVEAGLRSYNNEMPEEINRLITDRISDVLFCPTDRAIQNLLSEGYAESECEIVNSGDVMLDAEKFYSGISRMPDFDLPSEFILSTIHRAENTNDSTRLKSIVFALRNISVEVPVILPIHPRTKKIFSKLRINTSGLTIIDPIGYLEMVWMLQNCKLVVTDSGGVQKEAFFMEKPCLTLRHETEWVELVNNGYNILTGADSQLIYNSYKKMVIKKFSFDKQFYGSGKASTIIVQKLITNL
jgi:UDP-GlcNAc3NAcA epimerase